MSKPKLLDQVRDAIRVKHYSMSTEEAYLHWIKRFVLLHSQKNIQIFKQIVYMRKSIHYSYQDSCFSLSFCIRMNRSGYSYWGPNAFNFTNTPIFPSWEGTLSLMFFTPTWLPWKILSGFSRNISNIRKLPGIYGPGRTALLTDYGDRLQCFSPRLWWMNV